MATRLTSGGGLARIDMADNDNVDVSLIFLTVRISNVSRSSREHPLQRAIRETLLTYPMATDLLDVYRKRGF